MRLADKVAVVTGGASGIGRACAIEFASRGCDVVVADVHLERAEHAAATVRERGGRALAVRCDVSSDSDVAALKAAALAEFGRVDVVMSNAGIIAMGMPTEIPVDEWKRVLDVNLLGTVRMVNAFVPDMVEQGSGHFITTASTAGLFPYSYTRLPYAASKYGVVGLSEGLALYLQPQGITVSCLCPAAVPTNIGEQISVFGDLPAMQSPPLASMAPEDVAVLVAEAAEKGDFLVLTAPETHAYLVERARSMDDFLDAQQATIVQQAVANATPNDG